MGQGPQMSIRAWTNSPTVSGWAGPSHGPSLSLTSLKRRRTKPSTVIPETSSTSFRIWIYKWNRESQFKLGFPPLESFQKSSLFSQLQSDILPDFYPSRLSFLTGIFLFSCSSIFVFSLWFFLRKFLRVFGCLLGLFLIRGFRIGMWNFHRNSDFQI